MVDATTPKDWRTVLREQGRTLTWLAKQTGTKRRAVYGYSSGAMTPPIAWYDAVEEALGVAVEDRIADAIERARAEIAL